MFTRLALVAVLAASIPMMGASTADAAPGKNRGERAEKVRKGKKARAVKTTASKSRTTRSTKKTKNMVITTTRRTAISRNGDKSTKVIVVKKYKDKAGKRYMGLGKFPTYFGYGKRNAKRGGECVAAAKSRAGFGKRLIGIKGKKYGAHACDRAMNECRRELKFRKASGRNPYARCVIISRG